MGFSVASVQICLASIWGSNAIPQDGLMFQPFGRTAAMDLLRPSGQLLEFLWGSLGSLGGALRGSWDVLGASGAFWGPSGRVGASGRLLGAPGALHKNIVRNCCVLRVNGPSWPLRECQNGSGTLHVGLRAHVEVPRGFATKRNSRKLSQVNSKYCLTIHTCICTS